MLAGRVCEPTSDRVMEVYTDQPGMQFYSDNFLDGSNRGKEGIRYEYRTGFYLETQHYPDSPNHPDYLTVTIELGQIYKHSTVYRFSTQ
ncbi:hypothetical protein ACFL4K_02025 [Candidatus Neomarinimicrobiota bacterium]